MVLGAQPPHAASRENVTNAREIHSHHRAIVDARMVCMTLVPTQNEVDRDTRDGDIVRLRLDGLPYREISARVALSISQCQRIVEAARARRRGDLDIERHMDRQHADIERTLDLYRALIFGEELPSDQPVPAFQSKELHDMWWKGLERRGKFLGLDAPAQSHVMTEDLNETENVQAAEYMAELAVWARKNNAINVEGYVPTLPPGMDERVVANGHATMNGHSKTGHSMWHMAIEFPSEDDGLDEYGM